MNHVLDIIDLPDVGIVMPDGCRLSARIWMPKNADDAPVPAIVEHLPYRKRDGTVHRDELGHPYIAARGYACIRVDMRGNGESQGLMDDEYTPQELQDACDVIQWATEQTWCSGTVGMMGISWGGFNSLQVAALQPPALKAVISVCSTVDRFADDIHYKGGCLLTENVGWAANMLSYSSRPPDPALVGESWMDMWKMRLNNMPFLASTWMRHQKRDAYWQHGSVCEDYTAIKAAVLSVGGWHDGYRNTISHLVTNLSSPVKGIVGPWIHKYPHYAAPTPAIGFLQESLRWWDRWLKNANTGVEDDPAYRVWVMDSVKPKRWLPERPGEWVGEQHWPSKNINEKQLHIVGEHSNVNKSTNFGEEHTANNQDKDSALMLSDVAGACKFSLSSAQDCGKTSGEYFPFSYGPEFPDDQLADDLLSCCADTSVLSEPMTIIGAPTIKLTLSADKPMGLIVARLCDLRPDGSSAHITSGMLNLAHRESFEHPSLMQPGNTFSIDFALDQIAYRVPVGHSLRLALSTACWPFIWPSPQTVTLSISEGSMTLPVRTTDHSLPVHFEPPVTAAGWQTEVLREASSSREVLVDEASNEQITLIENDFGANRDLTHDLRSGSFTKERWSIKPDDPLSARGDIHWQQTGGRDDWNWKTDSCVSISCDEAYFYLSASLKAYNNDELIFEQTYKDNIPRKFI